MSDSTQVPLDNFVVDLRSDTVTKPTDGMRAAMASAEVGDECHGGDPTTARLERAVAEQLKKEAALFFPSGTMANLAALLLFGKPGTEVLVDVGTHVANWDLAGSAAIAGVAMRQVTPRGLVMNAQDARDTMRPNEHYGIQTSLLFIENTHSAAGGIITPSSEMSKLHEMAQHAGLPVHLDGARLWNAAVATGQPLSDFTQYADTVMVAFSKGLGAPVGAALAGSKRNMRLVDDIRKRLGGGMHQSGIIAAGALYGLQHHMQRLADDHAAAQAFAAAVQGIDGVSVVPTQTNIVMIELRAPIADDVERAAHCVGVKVSAWTSSRIRAVTHLDTPLPLVVEAGNRLADILRKVVSAAR